MSTNDIIQLVQEIQNQLDIQIPGVIARLTGSCILPYINNPHDTDVMLICFNQEQLEKCYKFKQNNNFHDIDFIIHCYPNTMLACAASYEYHFMQPIEQPYPDIYNPQTKLILKRFVQDFLQYNIHPKTKWLYHIYTIVAMWINGGYTLLDDDLIYIKRFHNRTATNEDLIHLKLKWQQCLEEDLCLVP